MNRLVLTSFLLASIATAFSFATARAAEITARQEDPATIRVTAPDAFELTFSMRKGFVASDNLQPWKARILLALALSKTTNADDIQRMFDTY